MVKKDAQGATGPSARLLPRITGFFFDRPWTTFLIWLVVVGFGVLSFTFLLRREGFPNVAIPIVVVNGAYAANDPAVVDASLAAPVSRIALKQPGVQSVSSSSESNFFTATVQYAEGTNAVAAKASLQKAVAGSHAIPKNADLSYAAPYFGVTGGSTKKIDATIAVYDAGHSKSLSQLTELAYQAANYLNGHKKSQIASYFVVSPFQTVKDPATGQPAVVQRGFNRYGERTDGSTKFYPAVTIGVASINHADVIRLDKQIRDQLASLRKQPRFSSVGVQVTASYAPQIKQEISELQRVLLEGLAAVLIIGSLIIAVRASLVTVISMVTVIAITLGVVFLLGYTLNVITLFALILGLSLIVDDTIIMVEAIDSAKRNIADRSEVMREAARKIGKAMVAATLTATLSFVPLAFVGGVLGSFIRAIPVTIIAALLVSLAAALIFIPLFSRFLLLGKGAMKRLAKKQGKQPVEVRLTRLIARPILWAQHSRPKEFLVGIAAVCIGAAFIGDGVFVFLKVPFNIFPPSKDTNQLSVTINYPPNTSVAGAAAIADHVDSVTGSVLGSNLETASYFIANDRTAELHVDLVPYGQRDPTAPELSRKIEARLQNYQAARVSASPVDVGPPPAEFVVNIHAADRPAAERLALNMAGFLKGYKLQLPDNKTASVVDASTSNPDIYQRVNGRPVIAVSARFSSTDTTTLINQAKGAITSHYTAARLQQFGLRPSDISFDLGQESENQKSFRALLVAFPLVLLAIYLLLMLQFRSLLQPLLIFMALPFSFLGIAAGLYLTHNPFSFFAMLGFFALIGLSIKNSILLTDYANQARREGMTPADAVVAALGERFRPLVATSLTAIFSLIPLALTSPFWESLAIVLIFGLLSSTVLVIFIFPYYYLGFEYARIRSRRWWRHVRHKPA